MTLKLYDATEAEFTLNFARGASTEKWKASLDPNTSLGIIFGNPSPHFFGEATLKDLGVAPDQALRTLDSTIINSTMTDVTIVHLFGDDVAIALWQGRGITEIWYAGNLVERLLEHAMAPGDNHGGMCQAALLECCSKVEVPGAQPPVLVPNGNPNACVAVATGCPASKTAACSCLADMCAACSHPTPAPPAPDDCPPDRRAMSNAACNAGARELWTATSAGPTSRSHSADP